MSIMANNKLAKKLPILKNAGAIEIKKAIETLYLQGILNKQDLKDLVEGLSETIKDLPADKPLLH